MHKRWVMLALALWPNARAAADEPHARFEVTSYDAPRACPSRRYFERRVADRLAAGSGAPRRTTRVKVVLRAGAGEARGTVTIEAGAGRSLEGASCKEVAEGLALITALALTQEGPAADSGDAATVAEGVRGATRAAAATPSAVAATRRAAGESARAASGAASGSAGGESANGAPAAGSAGSGTTRGAPAAGSGVAGTRSAGAGTASDAPASVAQSAGGESASGASATGSGVADTRSAAAGTASGAPAAGSGVACARSAAAGTTSGASAAGSGVAGTSASSSSGAYAAEGGGEPAPSSRASATARSDASNRGERPSPHLRLGLSAFAFHGLAPHVQPGLQLSAALVQRLDLVELSAELAGRLALSDTLSNPAGDAHFGFAGGALLLCAAARLGDSGASVRGCGVGEGGVLSWSATQTDQPQAYQRGWLALGPGAGLWWRGAWLGLGAGAELLFPVRRDSALLAGEVLQRVPAACVRLQLGLELSFDGRP